MAGALQEKMRRLGSPAGANLLLGLWLFLSTFVLPQTTDEATVTWILGALLTIASGAMLVASELRYLDTLLAVLLALAAAVLPAASTATRFNEVCVAIAVFVVSILSGGRTRGFHRRSHAR